MGVMKMIRRLVGGREDARERSAAGVGGSTVENGSKSPFQIASREEASAGSPVREQDSNVPMRDRIDRLVSSSDVFLFIKGTPQQPMCGFSANTIAIFESLGVPYATFDVLSDEAIRQGAKSFSQWPTFPQVYIRGEFIGGNDIVTEMYTNGELRTMMERVAS